VRLSRLLPVPRRLQFARVGPHVPPVVTHGAYDSATGRMVPAAWQESLRNLDSEVQNLASEIERRALLSDVAPSGVRGLEPVFIRRVVVPPEGLRLEEAVDKNAWVYRCLHIIAQNIASVPLRVMRRMPDGTSEPVDPRKNEVADRVLRLIQKPNAHMSGTDLIQAIVTWLNVREALVWMMWEPRRERTPKPESPDAVRRLGLPSALYLLPAHRVVKWLMEGSLMSYMVPGVGLEIPAWQVVRMGYYNPKEELRGLSPLSVAYQNADTDYAIELYHANMFERGLKLSGVLTINGPVSDEKFERYRAYLEQFAGVGNAHAVMLMDSQASFINMSTQPKDMDFQTLAEYNRNKISAAFGVPRFMLGEPDDSNRATAEVARRTFWQDTLVPQMRMIEDKLNADLMPYCGDSDMYLEFDYQTIGALSEDRESFASAFSQTASALKNVEDFVDRDEGRKLLRDRLDIDLAVVDSGPRRDTYAEEAAVLHSDNPAEDDPA